MAITYPGFSQPQGYDKSPDIIGQFARGYQFGGGIKDERDADTSLASLATNVSQPAAPGSDLPPLSQFGLPDRETLVGLLQNPQTRQQGLGLIQQARSARDDATDPLKKLQIAKATYDVAHQGDGPGPTTDMQNFAMIQKDPAFAQFISSKGAGNAPADVQTYMFYADQEKQVGRTPLSYIDYKAKMQTPGLAVTTNPDGTVSVTQGASGAKLTEGQSKDLGFYTRGLQANDGLKDIEGQLTNLPQQMAGYAPGGLGNYMRTPEFRQAKVEADNFLASILRKDSGAAITQNEFDLYGPMFLPVPGDDTNTIALKRQKRATALMAIRSGLGTAEAVAAANEQALGLDAPSGAPEAPADGNYAEGTVIEDGEGNRMVLTNGQWVPQ